MKRSSSAIMTLSVRAPSIWSSPTRFIIQLRSPEGIIECGTGIEAVQLEFAVARLVQGTDGNFYGTTYEGGNSNSSECFVPSSYGCGTAFKITPGGTLTTLYSFGSNNDAYPLDGLVQGTDGSFYGTTWVGGETNELCESGCGTVFSISVGLGPFVKTNPTFGKVGARVTILGNNLAGATSVTFNGISAKFKASSTYITARVPTDATTGTVEVVMPRKTLKSNVPFRVLRGAVGYSQ